MKYVLRGSIVTMDKKRRVVNDGYLGILDQHIQFVRSKSSGIPNAFKDAPLVKLDGYIYPGLVDLHNHLPFNFLKLWKVDRKYVDRYQWPRLPRYENEIKMPAELLSRTNAADLIKFVEVKSLVAGVTTIDGFAKVSTRYAGWLLRNVEVEPFKDEPPIYQSVPPLTQEKDLVAMKQKMDKGCNAFIYHLAEGTSPKLHQEFETLKKYGLLSDKLVAVHCAALTKEHWQFMGSRQAKLVWSPLSNLLLYGKTADVIAAKENGVLISLGTDWSPSGSKNLLWELKVADIINRSELGGTFTDEELVRMVTINPSQAIGWDDKIGRLARGSIADIAVFDYIENKKENGEEDNNPYRNLIQATERNLQLCIIGGRPRYGDLDILKDSLAVNISDSFPVGSRTKGLDASESPEDTGVGANVTFQQAKTNIQKTLADPKTAAKNFSKGLQMALITEPPLRLIIEDDLASPPNGDQKAMMATKDVIDWILNMDEEDMAAFPRVVDTHTMSDDAGATSFFSMLKENQNIPSYLVDRLKAYL